MKVLPESILKCLSKEDRQKIGQFTAEEVMAKAQIKNERQLQSMIVNLLRLKGIEPLWHRTNKRSSATVGWPDITFSVKASCEGSEWTEAHGWEVKFGDSQ